MLVAALQVLLTCFACFALWRLWSLATKAGADITFARIVTAGFLVRAIGAQTLFWISYLRLPFLRSLQVGNGYWFFAMDGPAYLASAEEMLRRGVPSPFSISPVYASQVFVMVLALCVAAFGLVASVAILLNCASYLAACLLLQRIGSPARLPRLVALAAISFGPGTILWSLQPLKDTLFLVLVVAFVAACFAWQETWRQRERPVSALAIAAAILGVVYALAGLRWYFAATLWGFSALFLFACALSAPRRVRALLSGGTLFLLLAVAVRLGAGGDMVPFVNFVGRTIRPEAPITAPVTSIPKYIAEVRRGFETTPGATTIATAPLSTAQVAPPVTTPVATPVATSATPPPQPQPSQPPSAPPQTTSDRMMAGAVAMLVPHSIAQRLGLIDVRGGRGLWLFADADTVVFVLVHLFSVVYCAAALRVRRVRVTPLFVLLVLVFAMTAIPMAYSVSNFGTLFRLRQMLYTLAAILPLTLAPRPEWHA
jgi:hypothetical protein